MERPGEDDSTPPPLAAPGSPAEIPGLGPIRVRALLKAGFGDVKALREATIEQLTAVPGMSEIKARHIQSYLAQFTAEALSTAANVAMESRQPQTLSCEPGELEAPATPLWQGVGVIVRVSSPSQTPPDVAREGELVLNLALALLLTGEATNYRARLLRETIGFMQLVRGMLQCDLTDAKTQERALRRLQTASAALSSAISDPEMDRKAQTRLADELAQVGNRLETLIGRTLRRATVEAADD
jgi:NAD-dependent DNA ligase